ncbi:SitI3 family protein [Kitasatospora griseola]|uniref:SitI3 family protein n=1 Tax=Kitasatospora griseola TaxID=2064 RepID=UPI00380FFFDF
MTVAHQIHLATTETAEQVAARVGAAFERARLAEQPPALDELLSRGGARTARGTTVSVSAPEPTPFDVIDHEFGVPAKVRIWIEPDGDRPMAEQDDDIAALLAGLLEDTPADLVAVHNYETVWLIRRGGELVLHEDPALWPDHRLALIKGPYRRESHQL